MWRLRRFRKLAGERGVGEATRWLIRSIGEKVLPGRFGERAIGPSDWLGAYGSIEPDSAAVDIPVVRFGIDDIPDGRVILVENGADLAPTAAAWFGSVDADLVYADEILDGENTDGENTEDVAIFKPAWSPHLALSHDLTGPAVATRGELVRATGAASIHDLVARIAEQPDLVVRHLPNLLVRSRAQRQFDPAVVAAGLERRGWNADVGGDGSVRWRAPDERPQVAAVIPTRDRVDLLQTAVEGLLDRTDHVDVRLVIVDNGSVERETFDYFEVVGDRATVVRHDHAFNFSELVNVGVAAASPTETVLLLNNDVEVRHPDWLLQLWGWLDADPDLAATGPKLLFRDGRIQHAGVVVGLRRIAGHYALEEPNEPRPGLLHDRAREVGALTAAAMLVRTSAFEAVGGFDEKLPVDFQDVDLCLRMRRDLDAVILYDPTFPLTHDQGGSRGSRKAPSTETVALMLERWGPALAEVDPYFSPHLDSDGHTYRLAEIPAIEAERRTRIESR